MPGRHHHDGRLFDKRLDHETVPVVDGQPHKRNVDLSGEQLHGQERGAADLRKQDDIGIIRSVLTDDCWYERVKICPAAETDRNPSALPSGAALHPGFGRFDLRENEARFFQHQLSGIGQFDAAGAAEEERRAQLLFQLANLQAERRLIDAEPLGGTRKIQFFRDRYKIAEMA